jgi:hypothetical protein
MLGGLLRASNESSLVDRYLGDLMKALDRIGRIAFHFYWHQKSFEERYGKHDLPELEDTLLTTFEYLGDLILFLMKKTISPTPLESGIMGPDIEDDGEEGF